MCLAIPAPVIIYGPHIMTLWVKFHPWARVWHDATNLLTGIVLPDSWSASTTATCPSCRTVERWGRTWRFLKETWGRKSSPRVKMERRSWSVLLPDPIIPLKLVVTATIYWKKKKTLKTQLQFSFTEAIDARRVVFFAPCVHYKM